MTKPAILGAACVLVALLRPAAQAQFQPAMPVCEELAGLTTAWQNFETQDVNATHAEVQQAADQVAIALDAVTDVGQQLSPAAFDHLRQAHQAVENSIDALPQDATPAEIQDGIADARDRERVAYQNFTSNMVCQPMRAVPAPAP